MAGFSRLRRADRAPTAAARILPLAAARIVPLRGSSLVGPASLLLLVLSYWNAVRYGPEMPPAARDGAGARGTTGVPSRAAVPSASFRFPSREERVRYYMGDWYDDRPHQNGTAALSPWDPSTVCDDVPYYDATLFGPRPSDRAFLFDRANLGSYGMAHYTGDVERYLFSSPSAATGDRIILSAGDSHPSLRHPVVVKSRELGPPPGETERTPVVALMNAERHFGFYQGERPAWRFWENRRGLPQDRPWRRKQDRLVWRGSERTGRSHGRSRGELLEAFRRRHGIVGGDDNATTTRAAAIPATRTLGIPMDVAPAPALTMKQMLRSKYLLSLEGNDVASGLKWMLYSDSVVFMPRPTHETWAMEGLLVPYVHYVPVEADLSDLGERVEWAHRNADRAREIAGEATEFVRRLYASPGATADNEWIHREMYRRYQARFGEELQKCPPPATYGQ